MSTIWGLFKIVSLFIIGAIAKICPYKNFAAWVVMIISFIDVSAIIFVFWSNNGFPNLVIGLTGIIVTVMGLTLVKLLTNVTFKVIKDQQTPIAYSESERLEVMRDLYENPSMTEEEALELKRKITGTPL